MNIIRNAFKLQGSWQYIVKIQYESHVFHEGDREEFLRQERCSQHNLWNAAVDSPLFELYWVNTSIIHSRCLNTQSMTSVKLEARSPKTGKVIYNCTSKTENDRASENLSLSRSVVLIFLCDAVRVLLNCICTCNLTQYLSRNKMMRIIVFKLPS